jgi:hypothetical protein
MTELERFQVEHTLRRIETKLETQSNSCEYGFYSQLKLELEKKLKE